MANFYVRKSGNDSNNGLSPGAAKLTIGSAVAAASAGDTIYVGAGYWHEQLTLSKSGTSTDPYTLVGDVTGEHTGDPGLVIWTTIGDHLKSAQSTADGNLLGLIALETFHWWTFRGFSFYGGQSTYTLVWANIGGSGNNNLEGIVFEDCTFCSYNSAFNLRFHTGVTTSPSQGLRIRRCLFYAGSSPIGFTHTNNSTAHLNVDILIENCVFFQGGSGTSPCIDFNHTGTASTHSLTGIVVRACTFAIYMVGVRGQNFHDTSGPSMRVQNCIFALGGTAITRTSGTAGSITEDFNLGQYALSLVTAGSGSNNTAQVYAMGGFMDWALQRFWGWSPYRIAEPILLSGNPGGQANPAIGFASTGLSPALDVFGNTRPYGRSGARDAGAIESRRLPRQEDTVVQAGDHSIRFNGGGFHDFFIPVAASAKTLTVQARIDSSYTGPFPRVQVLNIPGVANQEDVHDGTANAWDALTCSFTPTSPGVVRVRIESRDTSAAGLCYFDSLDIS
jgi:hypothetical protein